MSLCRRFASFLFSEVSDSEWVSSTFVVTKKDGAAHFVSDFRMVGRPPVRKPHPIPKVLAVLQEVEGFTCATPSDSNMGHCAMRLDTHSQKICATALPWGKRVHMWLPVRTASSLNIFQGRMAGLMECLKFIQTFSFPAVTVWLPKCPYFCNRGN